MVESNKHSGKTGFFSPSLECLERKCSLWEDHAGVMVHFVGFCCSAFPSHSPVCIFRWIFNLLQCGRLIVGTTHWCQHFDYSGQSKIYILRQWWSNLWNSNDEDFSEKVWSRPLFHSLILSDISEALEPQSGENLPNYLEASEGENTHGVANAPASLPSNTDLSAWSDGNEQPLLLSHQPSQ